MKKIYFLFLLCCLSYVTFAQSTVTIYATGAMGAYITGTAATGGGGTRTDGNITSTAATSRGYGVFDLSSIPAGATVTSVVIGFNVAVYFGGGAPSGWDTYGYAGDLSTVTVAATLFADMVAGTSLSTATYGAATGNQTLVSTAASTAFIQTNAGSTVSICWTGGGTKTYIITGETGTAATTGTHAPYLQVTYTCPGLSGVSASAAPNPLCVGAPLSLTAVATGATSYSWSGPGPYTSTAQSPTFITTTTSAGVYTLTAYNNTGCGIQATTAAVSLNATPVAAITSTTSLIFCVGQDVLLTGTTGAGYTYQWYQSGGALFGATNQTYTAINSGGYTVDITDPTSGCSNTSASTEVSAIPHAPPLVPAGSVGVCTGSDITLGVDLTGVTTGINYQWTVGGVAITGGDNSTYTTGTGGVYYCILTLTSCIDTTQSTTVNILPLPVPVVSPSGGLLKTSNTYSTYQWFLNLVSIPGATSYSYFPTVIGSYRVRVSDGNGCINYSDPYALTYLGVAQVNAAAIKIYPNPTTQMVHIESADPVRAVISSIEGKKLMDKAAVTDIDMNELPGGIYLIMLYNDAGDRVFIDKLIKE